VRAAIAHRHLEVDDEPFEERRRHGADAIEQIRLETRLQLAVRALEQLLRSQVDVRELGRGAGGRGQTTASPIAVFRELVEHLHPNLGRVRGKNLPAALGQPIAAPPDVLEQPGLPEVRGRPADSIGECPCASAWVQALPVLLAERKLVGKTLGHLRRRGLTSLELLQEWKHQRLEIRDRHPHTLASRST